MEISFVNIYTSYFHISHGHQSNNSYPKSMKETILYFEVLPHHQDSWISSLLFLLILLHVVQSRNHPHHNASSYSIVFICSFFYCNWNICFYIFTINRIVCFIIITLWKTSMDFHSSITICVNKSIYCFFYNHVIPPVYSLHMHSSWMLFCRYLQPMMERRLCSRIECY